MFIVIIDSGLSEYYATQSKINIKGYTTINLKAHNGELCLETNTWNEEDIIDWMLFPPKEEIFSDPQGHGTMVTSLIHHYAKNNNYHFIRILDNLGEGYDDVLIEALHFARTLKPDIINISLGSFSEIHRQALHEITEQCIVDGIQIICAATSIPSYPAFFSHTTTIANQLFIDAHGLNSTIQHALNDTLHPNATQIPDTSSAAAIYTGLVAAGIDQETLNAL